MVKSFIVLISVRMYDLSENDYEVERHWVDCETSRDACLKIIQGISENHSCYGISELGYDNNQEDLYKCSLYIKTGDADHVHVHVKAIPQRRLPLPFYTTK